MRNRGFEIVTAYQVKGIRLPKRKTVASAGYDIESAEGHELKPHAVTFVKTGLKAYMKDNEYLGIHIRSGFSVKNAVGLVNGQGVIDADYYNNEENEGHILIAFYNYGNEPIVIQKGERIAQGVFYTYLTTDDDCAVDLKRKGGLGSTGMR